MHSLNFIIQKLLGIFHIPLTLVFLLLFLSLFFFFSQIRWKVLVAWTTNSLYGNVRSPVESRREVTCGMRVWKIYYGIHLGTRWILGTIDTFNETTYAEPFNEKSFVRTHRFSWFRVSALMKDRRSFVSSALLITL